MFVTTALLGLQGLTAWQGLNWLASREDGEPDGDPWGPWLRLTVWLVIAFLGVLAIVQALARAGVFGRRGLLVQVAKLTVDFFELLFSPLTALLSLITGTRISIGG